MTALPDVALGPVLAATIAALISLLGLIISKENKTSEFRQIWIDALRAELSCYIAHLHNISGIAGVLERTDLSGWEKSQADFLGINKSSISIRLRLNPEETKAKAIVELLDAFEQMFPDGEITNTKKLNELERKLVGVSQELLKSEWKRVKSGEVVFQIARATSFAVLLVGIAVLWFLLST